MKKAYFLLEALIATVILGVAITSLMSSLTSASTSIKSSLTQGQTISLCEDILESLRYLWLNGVPLGVPALRPRGAFPLSANPLPVPPGPPWTTGWRVLTTTTTPPLRDPRFTGAYQITRADSDPRGPINVGASNTLYFVDLYVMPLDGTYGNGATFTIIMAQREKLPN